MLKLAALNELDQQAFTAALAGVFENSPWVAARTALKRPFQTRAELLAALCDTVMKSTATEKLALIRAHPDLAASISLTAESQREQAAAGLDKMSAEEIAQFQTYNGQYRDRFGFPFVICARENKKEAILAAFPARLRNSREAEMEQARREIFKIAELRLQDLVQPI